MTETTCLGRHIGAEVLREIGWEYLFDPSLPVREPTEEETAHYEQRHRDGFYAALLCGWTDAEVDAALAENARRGYEQAGRPDDEPPALTEAGEAALAGFMQAHDEQDAAEAGPFGSEMHPGGAS